MNLLRRGLLVATGIGLLCGPPATAWSPETRVRMVDRAVSLMPDTLRRTLQKHREALLRGVLTPMVHEDEVDHRPPWDADGELVERIAVEAGALADLLEEPNPFDRIAEQFGRLAHFVLDAGFPPGASGVGDGRYAHFSRFCETRRDRFRLIFEGHDEPNLVRDDYRRFATAILERARERDVDLARIYARAGNPPHPAHFDDRSIPFAVGSLAYSDSINDVVRLWLDLWRDGGGDTGRTPYLKRSERPAPANTPAHR